MLLSIPLAIYYNRRLGKASEGTRQLFSLVAGVAICCFCFGRYALEEIEIWEFHKLIHRLKVHRGPVKEYVELFELFNASVNAEFIKKRIDDKSIH